MSGASASGTCWTGACWTRSAVGASFVQLVGEPGIGKTHLVDQLVADARGRGVHVGVGRCARDDGAPPMWPWRSALAELGIEVDLTAGRRPGGQPRAAGVRAVRAGRVRAAGGLHLCRPCVVLDDLHWSDDATLRALTRVVDIAPADVPLCVVAHPALAPRAVGVAGDARRGTRPEARGAPGPGRPRAGGGGRPGPRGHRAGGAGRRHRPMAGARGRQPVLPHRAGPAGRIERRPGPGHRARRGLPSACGPSRGHAGAAPDRGRRGRPVHARDGLRGRRPRRRRGRRRPRAGRGAGPPRRAGAGALRVRARDDPGGRRREHRPARGPLVATRGSRTRSRAGRTSSAATPPH